MSPGAHFSRMVTGVQGTQRYRSGTYEAKGQGPISVTQVVTASPGDSTVQVRDLRDMKLRARGPFLLPRMVTVSPGDLTV